VAELHYLVPEHNEGTETDIIHSLSAETTDDAEDLFVDIKDRLLNVTNWDKYAGMAEVCFGLADSSGHKVKRHARRGDHVLVTTISHATEQYDWLTIEALEYDDYPDTGMETFAMRLRPSVHPDNADKTDISADTTTIVVLRNQQELSAIYHGRNHAIGNGATWQGIPNEGWSALIKGMLEYYMD
jgi:hypothetical protein